MSSKGDALEDVAVLKKKQEQKLKPPSKYKVVLLNDDYTTMDFVVVVLQKFFNLSGENATKIMLDVHTKGQAVCGVYSRDIAETKTQQVNSYSRNNDHPLLCICKKVD